MCAHSRFFFSFFFSRFLNHFILTFLTSIVAKTEMKYVTKGYSRILSLSLTHTFTFSLRSVYLFHTWMHNSLTQTQDLVSILNSTFCTYLLPTYLSIPSFTQTNTFFKKWANPASFCFYFLSFHMTNIAHLL